MSDQSKFGEFMSDVEKTFDQVSDAVVKGAKTVGDIAEKSAKATGEVIKTSAENVAKGVVVAADFVGNTVQEGVESTINTIDKIMDDRKYNSLKPIFPSFLDGQSFELSNLIRITPRWNDFIDSPKYKKAIGRFSYHKGVRVINIFDDSIRAFDISLYPDNKAEFYICDPTDPKHYIVLDEYFNWIKIVRVSELQYIAQELGAKHSKITYFEQKEHIVKKKHKAEAKLKTNTDANMTVIPFEHELTRNECSIINIEDEMYFLGKSPDTPQLRYLKDDPSVNKMIETRMHKTAPTQRQRLVINLSKTTGINSEYASKIDAVLREMKCSGNVSMVSKVEREARKFLECEIDFV